jgi:hypothetical protein
MSITINTSETIVSRSNALMDVAYFLSSNLTHALDFLNLLSLTASSRTGIAPSRTGDRTEGVFVPYPTRTRT